MLLLLLASSTTTFALPVATTSDQLGEGANSTDLGRTRRGFAGCSAGFHDVTRGRSYWTKKHHWGCGKGCDGGMYTDWACRCACQPVGCDGLISNSNTCPNSCPEIRFKKYEYSGPDVEYPLTESVADKLLAANSNAESPVCPNHAASNVIIDPAAWTSSTYGIEAPTLPSDGQGFWDEFLEVVRLQQMRKDNENTPIEDFITVPSLFKKDQLNLMTLTTASKAVRSDFPTHFPTKMAEKLLGDGATFRSDIVPKRSASDFVRNQVLLARLIGWAVSEVSDTAFAAKWHFGRPRPEEVAWKVKDGVYDACGDVTKEGVKDEVNALGMSTSYDFTAYNEPGSGSGTCTDINCGSPRHPSFPAMHSAASVTSLFLPLVLDLDATQIKDLRALDFAVASSRTFAGVHYATDNRAGLAMGSEVLKKRLPDYLADLFGGDNKDKIRDLVTAEIDVIESKGVQTGKHDWYSYEACTDCSLKSKFPL